MAAVENAFARALQEQGLRYESRLTFPEPAAFAQLLAANRFKSELVVAYDRPTVLRNGEQGLRHWLQQFFAADLHGLPESTQEALMGRAEELARPGLWHGKAWVSDYRRLRVVAHI